MKYKEFTKNLNIDLEVNSLSDDINHLREEIKSELNEQYYSDYNIKVILEKYYSKITNDDIIKTRTIALSKQFTTENSIIELREFNVNDNVLINYLDYVLEDGSKILIRTEILKKLNNSIKTKQDLIEQIKLIEE